MNLINKILKEADDFFTPRNPERKVMRASEDNLGQFEETGQEFCRSVLNNGWFTIAHNWPSNKMNEVLSFMEKTLGVTDRNFLGVLRNMFIEKGAYEKGGTYTQEGFGYDEEDDDYGSEEIDISEEAWEEMSESAGKLDRIATKLKIIDKMQEHINW